MADTIEVNGSGDELDRFAQLWREASPDDDGDPGQLSRHPSTRALVIHAERA